MKRFIFEIIDYQFCVIPTMGFIWHRKSAKLMLNFIWLNFGISIILIKR